MRLKKLKLILFALVLAASASIFTESAFAAEPTIVNSSEEFLDALNSETCTSIQLGCDISTSKNISLGKKVDLNGNTWTVTGGTVFGNGYVSGGTFQSKSQGEIRTGKTVSFSEAVHGTIEKIQYSSGEQDSSEYVQKNVDGTSVNLDVKTDNVLGSLPNPKSISAIVVDGEWYAAAAGGYTKFNVSYVFEYYDSEEQTGKPVTESIDNSGNRTTFYPDTKLESPKTQTVSINGTKYEFKFWYIGSPANRITSLPSSAENDLTVVGRYEPQNGSDWNGQFPGGWAGRMKGFGSMSASGNASPAQEAEQPAVQEETVPVQGHVSTAKSKTTVKLDDSSDAQELNLDQLLKPKETEKTSRPMLIIGIAVMVVALLEGIRVLTKKQ